MTTAVRPAVAADVPRLVAMARALHETSRQAWAFDAARLDLFARGLMASPAGLVLALDVAGHAVGLLAASFADHPLGAGLYGMEWAFWIDAEHRGGPGAAMLLEAYEADARRRGAALIGLANLAGPTDPATSDGVARLFVRAGFTPREQHFDKALV